LAVLINTFIPPTFIQKGEELHVSTYIYITTDVFPLILELLSSCRNIHQIQVEYNENTFSREAQKGKGGQWQKTSTTLSQVHSTTDIQTHLAANHAKEEAGRPTPGAGAPTLRLLGPTSAGGAALK
jgi:hypothetical protein